MLRRFLLALALTLATPAFATPAFAAPRIVITNDLGGLTTQYNSRWNAYRKARTRIIIKGACVSACARFMTLPNTCAGPHGYFLLHAMRDARDNVMYEESIADSKLWESSKAYALQAKYDVWGFGLQEETPPSLNVPLERGVSIQYVPAIFDGKRLYQKFLRVKATLFVPRCL